MKKLITIAFSLCFFIALSQNKMLTMEDAIIKGRTTLAPKTLKQINWIKNTNDFYYIDNKSGQEALYKGNAEKGKPEILVTLSDLNKALRKTDDDTLATFPAIEWEDVNSFIFKANKKRFLWITAVKTLETKALDNFPDEAENIDKDKKKGIIAFTKKNNLYLWNAGKVYTITDDKDENIVNGKSVHREEFGIKQGTFWSPGANYLAFYRMDQRMVKDYPIIDYSVKPAKEKPIKYPMAGDTSHQVTVGVFDMKTLKTIFLKTPPPVDHYLTNIAWSPDEKHIYIAELNREQNDMKLNSYNAQTGNFEKTIIEQTDKKYIEPLHPIVFVPGTTQFILQSRLDGWNHLYLNDASGKFIKQLTKGEWEVTNMLGFSAKGDMVYFECTMQSPLNRDVYSVSLTDGKMTRITKNDGYHKATLSSDGKYFIDNFSNTNTPNIVSVYNTANNKNQELLVADNPLKDYKTAKTEMFAILNPKGDKLYCRMFKPVDFDSTKHYPAIVYLYGGPEVQLITNSWLGGANLWFQYMAEHGYVVFTLDNRGSVARGKAWEQTTFRQLGTVEMEDQLEGAAYLKSLKYVDSTRVGIHGWSFGGFMTTSLMTRHPGVFKVAVAGGPVIDWSYYEVMYTERYMDTPQENKEGYDNNNLLNYVDKLKGKLMLIHGTSDDVVLWQQSLMYIKKAVDKNIPIDYFVYPGHPHNVLGKDRVHLMNKVSNYFFDYL